MAKSLSPETVAGLIQSLGGEIVEHDNLRFDIPAGLVRSVIPELNKYIGVRKISERTEATASGPQTVILCECLKTRPEDDRHVSDLGKMLLR